MKNVGSKMLDHLGLVAGCYDELGIAGIVDARLPKTRSFQVSHGVIVKAMLLNGLGYVDRPLYMCSEYFSKLPCERLLGEGVLPEYLNDDALGRTLDAIYEFGPTELFSSIVFMVMRLRGWHTHLLHVDTTTTSFSLYGDYPEEGEADD